MLQALRDKIAALQFLAEREGLSDADYAEAAMTVREYNRLMAQERRYKASVLRALQVITERDSGANDAHDRIRRVM